MGRLPQCVVPYSSSFAPPNPLTDFITVDELCRCGSGGILYGLIGGFGIGLPPVIHFGSDYLKEKIVGPCLRGEKRICLAITEVRFRSPRLIVRELILSRTAFWWIGCRQVGLCRREPPLLLTIPLLSLVTSAVKTADGKHYIVNGSSHQLLSPARSLTLARRREEMGYRWNHK